MGLVDSTPGIQDIWSMINIESFSVSFLDNLIIIWWSINLLLSFDRNDIDMIVMSWSVLFCYHFIRNIQQTIRSRGARGSYMCTTRIEFMNVVSLLFLQKSETCTCSFHSDSRKWPIKINLCKYYTCFPLASMCILILQMPIGRTDHRSFHARTHHSVQIHDRYVDNIMTLYRLRRASGRPPDCTQYMCYTARPNSIQ